MKTKSSPAKKRPLPAAKEREGHDPSKMQLQLVDPSRPTSPLIKLPSGWVIERRPRRISGRVDRYFHEPGSGRQFRSLIEVQRYLSGEMAYNYKPRRLLKPGTPTPTQHSMQIVPHVFRSASPFKLPPDWTVEEKPRANVNYAGVVDRYYIEPGTGQRFRSLRAVERYVTGMDVGTAAFEVPKSSGYSKYIVLKYPDDANRTTTPRLLQLCEHSTPLTASGSRKKQTSGEEVDPMLDFTSPPAKVKWVLGGASGCFWKPSIGESVVPDSVQQTWTKTFMLSIQDKY